MSDFLTDDTGDMAITNGDISLATGLDEMRQRLMNKLSLFQGEWFFNQNDGVPYFSKVLGKNDPVSINSVFVQAILSVPGVIELKAPIEYDFDRSRRTISVSFTAITTAGEVEITT